MKINWYGQSCFQINISKNKKEQVNVLVDPVNKESGLKLPKIKADILLLTDGNGGKEKPSDFGDPFVIERPGEYEIKDIIVRGIAGENNIYTIEAEKIKICHLGGLNQTELTSKQVEEIGDADILMIPVGNIDTIDSKDASKVVSQIDPRIVIPMNYKIPKLKLDKKNEAESVDKFLKVMGKKEVEPQDKFIVRERDLSDKGLEIIVLNP
jgi:L-ascorbate metabolism protein UlaG (beta-lactamase superfamily)